jgi:hypothetical protein
MAGCSVCCGVVNCSFSVVFGFNVIRKGSGYVENWGYVKLSRLSCGCVARGVRCVVFDRLWCNMLGPRCSSSGRYKFGVIILSLGGLVLGSLGVVTGRCVCCCCCVVDAGVAI